MVSKPSFQREGNPTISSELSSARTGQQAIAPMTAGWRPTRTSRLRVIKLSSTGSSRRKGQKTVADSKIDGEQLFFTNARPEQS
jgi:hypothetical protein